MDTTGQANALSTRFLKKHGYFKKDSEYGGITWSCNDEEVGSINFWVHKADMNIQLIYVVTSHSTGEVQRFDYKVPLLKTPCNYGGFRYWFQCNDCHRKVGVIYISTHGKCRKCSQLCYASQRASRPERMLGSKNFMYMLDEERAAMRVTHYAGKPTKRYLRWLTREERCERVMSWVTGRLRL